MADISSSSVEWAQIATIEYQFDATSAALFFYDFLLTIPDEVRLFWQSPRSLGSVLYLLIRYCALITNVACLVHNLPDSVYPEVMLTGAGCQAIQDIMTITQLVSTAAGSAFIALRIMALWSRSWYLGSILFVLGLVSPTPLGQALFFAFYGTAQALPYSACIESTNSFTLVLLYSYGWPLCLH
ncbi:hypothetical protein GY45DRAFT_546379 [Cubamyces sp. BRFM 1775]|nr:hypothetical protein GY45DRAFT_546379 [Cubamyces sp. BRFM 1775]